MKAAPRSEPAPRSKPLLLSLPDPSAMRVLEASRVAVDLGGRRILKDVSFFIPKGEFVCLCGPNGAGKSTFLKAALGLVRLAAGEIRILGKPARDSLRAVGYVPQRKTFDRDFPATVADLVVASLRGRWPMRIRDDEREKARATLRRVGGEHLIERPLAGLSGGEAQRAFLARALVTDPALVVLDEPTAGVDVKGRAEFLDLLAEISASDELAALLVTHNLAAVSRCAERVVYLEAGVVAAWGLPGELIGRESFTALALGGVDHGPSALPDED